MSEPTNPIVSAQRLARQELPRRFYKEARAAPGADGFVVLLDGRTAKTPGRRALRVDRQAVAEAMAAEWAAQGETIDPATMPVTRIVNAAIDGVAEAMDAVRADIVSHAGTDLVCYRADEPEGLVSAEEAAWAPLVDWTGRALGAALSVGTGIAHVRQSPEALAAIDRAIAPFDPLDLAALHTITTIGGSAVIALALAKGTLTADEAWTAAHVDEDWQIRLWGADEEAMTRRAARRREFDAAALILAAAG